VTTGPKGMDWVRVNAGFLREPVVADLVDALSEPGAALNALALRPWVGEFFPEGIITASPRRIEDGAAWRGQPGVLFAAMVKVGYLVQRGDGYELHKFEEENAAIWREVLRDRRRAQERRAVETAEREARQQAQTSAKGTRRRSSTPPTGKGTQEPSGQLFEAPEKPVRGPSGGESTGPSGGASEARTDVRTYGRTNIHTHPGDSSALGAATAAAVCVIEVPEGQEPEGPEKPRLVLVPAEDEVRKEVQRAWLAYLVMRPGEVFSDAYQRALTIAVVRRGSAVRESFDGRAHHPDNLVPKMAPFLRLLTDAAITKGLDLRRDKRWRGTSARPAETAPEPAQAYDYDAGFKSLKEVSAALPWNRGGS
jgi:hypothetical protein